MALRHEDVAVPARVGGAAIYAFPSARVRRGTSPPVRRGMSGRARRRRVEVRRAGAALVTALVVVCGVIAAGPGGTAMASRPGAPSSVVMAPGDTVWDVAERYAPDGIDRRAYVDAVLDLNGVEGPVAAGERLLLPGARGGP